MLFQNSSDPVFTKSPLLPFSHSKRVKDLESLLPGVNVVFMPLPEGTPIGK